MARLNLHDHPAWKLAAIGIAVILILLAIAATILRITPPFPLANPAATPAMPALTTRIGEVRYIALADGSQLILDSNTSIQTFFSRHQRLIKLRQGRVRFVVASDKVRPFIVHVGDDVITATGPIFDISYRGNARIHLLHGQAEVRHIPSGQGQTKAVAMLLHSGDKMEMGNSRGARPIISRALPSDGQWIDEIQGFEDVPVKNIIAEASLYTTDRIELAEPSLGEKKISGIINVHNANAAASNIAEYLGVEVDRSYPGRIIIGKAK